jgi:DeoR/GlpR family transcriptional regulator of sugar metabolism
MPQKLAYSVENFAGLLDVSAKTIRREIERGVLPVRHIRGRIVIAASDGEAYLRAQADRGESNGR